MTSQMRALLIIAAEPAVSATLLPAIDFERERFDWSKIDPRMLAEEQAAAIAWVWNICKDVQFAETNTGDLALQARRPKGLPDPFEAFGKLSRETQVAITKALLARHQ